MADVRADTAAGRRGGPLGWLGGALPNLRWQSVGFLLLAAAFAYIAGLQYVSPNGRILQVLGAVVVVYLAARVSSIVGLTMIVVLLPYPKGTSYGNTNMTFVFLIFLIWIFREIRSRGMPFRRSALDAPIVYLLGAYLISFYNVAPADLQFAWSNFANVVTCALLMYMVYYIVSSLQDLHRVIIAQAVSCFVVCLFALYEQWHPGSAIVPGWIDFSATHQSEIGVRVSSVFNNFELFGEYCAINIVLQLFLWTRATSATRRWLLAGLMLLTLYCMFTTVTRGSVLALLTAIGYLAWAARRTLNFRTVVLGAAAVAVAVFGMDYFVGSFTNSGSTLTRLGQTTLVNGMPEDRATVWTDAWSQFLRHPIIGRGPYYDVRPSLVQRFWPHNVYLFYLNIIGLLGFGAYVWLLFRLWKASRPIVARLDSGSYEAGLTLALRAAFFTFLVDQFKIDYVRSQIYSYFVWFMFGVIAAVGKVNAVLLAQGAVPGQSRERAPEPAGLPRAGGSRTPMPPRIAPRPAVPLSDGATPFTGNP